MPNRILREGILTSERVNALNWEAEVFYRRLMSVVDDFGRFSAHPSLLRAALYPLKLDTVRDANMERLLALVEQARLVRVYEVAGKRYLEMLDFKQQVRAKESKYPTPPPDDVQLHITCAADAQQMQANAHLGGGGDVFGDEDDKTITPSHACAREPDTGEPFSMHSGWRPSEQFGELARMSGIPDIGHDALGEFVAYWLSRPERKRTQAEWDHAYLKNLKATKARPQAQSPPARSGRRSKQDQQFIAARSVFGTGENHERTIDGSAERIEDHTAIAGAVD